MTQKFYFIIYGQNSDFLQWRRKNKNMGVKGNSDVRIPNLDDKFQLYFN